MSVSGFRTMNKFKFDPADTPDQNIDRFINHLKTYDQEMAEILLKNLPQLNPLPEAPAQRTVARKSFSRQVLVGLQQLRAVEKGRAV
jgi:hypothetical protein